MSLKKAGKVTLLQFILQSKDVLFGAFSDKLTKVDKSNKWKEVHAKAISLGLVPLSKDYLYTRDTYWQNLKKYTMKKIDNRKQTGSEGGPDCKLTDTDNIIMDIIGREIPLVVGLPTSETWEPNTVTEPQPEFSRPPTSNTLNLPTPLTTEQSSTETPAPLTTHPSLTAKTTKRRPSCPSDEEDLRLKKIKLSLEIMKKESYLKDLQILKLERELTLPPSEFTAMFPSNVVVVESVDSFVKDDVED